VSNAASSAGKLPRGERIILGVMAACAVIGLAGGWWAAGRKPLGVPPDRPRQLGEFSLTDRTGRPVTRADLSNQWLVVNFVFTSCSISCQQVSHHMAEIQRLTDGQPDVRLVSFSVDPRTDTPEVLAEFGRKFGADTNRWLLLTGEKPVLYSVIESSFLNRSAAPEWSGMPGGFVHAERIAVVDAAGRLRAFFDGMASSTPRDAVEFIQRFRLEPSKP
jgi:protein SCO1/2